MSSSHSIESLSHSFTVLTHLLHLFASCSVSIFIHLISEVIRVLIGSMKNSKSKFWNLNMASSTYSLNWLIKNYCYSYFLPVGEHLKIHILFSQTFAKKKSRKIGEKTMKMVPTSKPMDDVVCIQPRFEMRSKRDNSYLLRFKIKLFPWNCNVQIGTKLLIIVECLR